LLYLHGKKGKGGDIWTVVIGKAARSVLLVYKNNLKDVSELAPIFQNNDGRRLTGQGVGSIFSRLSINFTRLFARVPNIS